MIAQILSYIPDQLTVGLTCKKFHEISCYIKFFRLSLRRNLFTNKKQSESEIGTENQETDIFESMINSQRRINFLSIDFDCNEICDDERLLEVVRHFGNDVKQLELSCIKVKDEFIDFLNLMKNLVKIKLYRLNGVVNIDGCKLKLKKLKGVSTSECPIEVLKMFNVLPPGVLEKVELMWHPSGENYFNNQQPNIEIFKNQQNIKEITAHSYCNNIDFKQLKLISLLYEDFATFKLQQNLKGQNKLKLLSSHSFQNGDLKFICNELKSLEFLHGSFHNILSSEFSELSKLMKLKNLRVSWVVGGFVDDRVNESLFIMQSESLKDLEIKCCKVMELAVAQLGVNCPNLQRLNFDSKASFNVINLIIRNFKNLRCLVFRGGPDEDDRNYYGVENLDNDIYAFSQGLKHRKLRKLSVCGWCNEYETLPKLISCCINLRVFKTTLPLNCEMLQKILTSCSKLEKLCLITEFTLDEPKSLHKISLQMIEVLKKFGSKLVYFYCEFNSFDDEVSPKMVIEEFEPYYTFIEMKGDSHNLFKWEMQKSCIKKKL